MGAWHNAVENNKSWKGSNGAYIREVNGVLLSMRFSKHLNITMYDCFSLDSQGQKVEHWKPFDLEFAWKVMWGKRDISPDHITILTRERYHLSNPGWVKDRGSFRMIHKPSQFIYEPNQDGTFNNISIDEPGSVQVYLRKLAAIGLPINQRLLVG